MSAYDRKRVENYLDEQGLNYPLVFEDFEGMLSTTKSGPLIELVENVLELTRKYRSFLWLDGKQDSFETSAGRWRSVADIWRHIIYFRPEVTIFEVMETIYAHQEQFVGHFCEDVMRRVFAVKSCGSRLYTEGTDEFGFYFDTWKDIGG